MMQRKIALSIEEAADYTGIGRNTLRQLVEWKMCIRDRSYMTFCGNIINKMKLGFSYDDANVCDKIADIEIPVLVINSEADIFFF